MEAVPNQPSTTAEPAEKPRNKGGRPPASAYLRTVEDIDRELVKIIRQTQQKKNPMGLERAKVVISALRALRQVKTDVLTIELQKAVLELQEKVRALSAPA